MGKREILIEIEGIPMQGHLCLVPSSRGGHVKFFFSREEEKYGGLPNLYCELASGSAHELKCFLEAKKSRESIKATVWHHYCHWEENYEELRKRYPR